MLSQLTYFKIMTGRNLLLFIVLTMVFTGLIFSQERKKLPIPGIYSTGVDNNKLPLADGEVDPHYVLAQSSDDRFPGPETKVVFSEGFPMGSWIQNDNNSKWIAPRADAGEFNAMGGYIYSLYFSLDGFKPETAEVRGFWTTDNSGAGIVINNQTMGYVTDYTAFNIGFYPFEIKQGFKPGMNTISFVVYNGEAPTGLRVVIYGEAEPLDVAEK